jgi:hypothetical protein
VYRRGRAQAGDIVFHNFACRCFERTTVLVNKSGGPGCRNFAPIYNEVFWVEVQYIFPGYSNIGIRENLDWREQ